MDGRASDLPQVDCLLNSMKQVNQSAVNLVESIISSGVKTWAKMALPFGVRPLSCCAGGASEKSVICPPEDTCVPRCLITISRHATIGDVIAIPFSIRNTGNVEKRYTLGVRPFTDEHGIEVMQPSLDDVHAVVKPHSAVQREVKIDLDERFEKGRTYETDIVIRERRHNQNVCLRIHTHCADDVPVVAPYDEKDLDMHFHRWYHHYYCQPPRAKEREVQARRPLHEMDAAGVEEEQVP